MWSQLSDCVDEGFEVGVLPAFRKTGPLCDIMSNGVDPISSEVLSELLSRLVTVTYYMCWCFFFPKNIPAIYQENPSKPSFAILFKNS